MITNQVCTKPFGELMKKGHQVGYTFRLTVVILIHYDPKRQSLFRSNRIHKTASGRGVKFYTYICSVYEFIRRWKRQNLHFRLMNS
jgi:hypothetical protein